MKKQYSKYDYVSNGLICPHCHEVNPAKAFVCLHCFEIIHKQKKLSFWKRTIQGNRAGLLLAVLFCLVSMVLIQRWLGRVENHMNVIQEQNQIYHESLSEFMRTKVSDSNPSN